MSKNNDKSYTTRASAHGFDYQPLIPTTFDMTLEEAKKDVELWRIFADTVGGDAIIVHKTHGIIE